MNKDNTATIIVNDRTYYSLTNIARQYAEGQSPGYVIQGWLRSQNTLELLKIWEQYNNPHFSIEEYEKLLKRIKTSSFTLTAKQWLDNTGAIGIISNQGKNGGTYAEIEIVYDFMCWVSPQFRFTLISLFDLKEQAKKLEAKSDSEKSILKNDTF